MNSRFIRTVPDRRSQRDATGQYSRERTVGQSSELNCPVVGESEETAMVRRLDQRMQNSVVIVVQGNKAEWLRNYVESTTHRLEHLCHSVDVAGVRGKSNFDEIAFCERFWKVQQPPSCRDDLQLGFGWFAVAQFQERRRG